VGTHDHMVTPGPALAFAKMTGSALLALNSDCGHLVVGCERARVNDSVRTFLNL